MTTFKRYGTKTKFHTVKTTVWYIAQGKRSHSTPFKRLGYQGKAVQRPCRIVRSVHEMTVKVDQARYPAGAHTRIMNIMKTIHAQPIAWYHHRGDQAAGYDFSNDALALESSCNDSVSWL